MSELAYDITYLFESGTALVEAPARPAVQAAPAAPPCPSGITTSQEALARELLQFAELHDNWIRQYERMYGSERDAN